MARTPKSCPPPGRVPPTCAPCHVATRHTALAPLLWDPHAPAVPPVVQSNETITLREDRSHVMPWVDGSNIKSLPVTYGVYFLVEVTTKCAIESELAAA